MFLLDTNVVSEIRKVASGRANAGVSEWSRAIDAELLHISAVTVQELEAGVLRIERKGLQGRWPEGVQPLALAPQPPQTRSPAIRCASVSRSRTTCTASPHTITSQARGREL